MTLERRVSRLVRGSLAVVLTLGSVTYSTGCAGDKYNMNFRPLIESINAASDKLAPFTSKSEISEARRKYLKEHPQENGLGKFAEMRDIPTELP